MTREDYRASASTQRAASRPGMWSWRDAVTRQPAGSSASSASGQRPFMASTRVSGPHSGATVRSICGSGAKARVTTVSNGSLGPQRLGARVQAR